jgi:uncharacterized Ntn-hydrolase superfamily protein
VGTLAPFAEPGVGAVATQSIPLRDYGPHGLAQMRRGVTAPDALAELLSTDAAAHSRQVAMVGADGSAAVHTGSGCIPHAVDHLGEAVTVQGNLLASEHVVPAMVAAYAASSGDLGERLLAALDAGQHAGGDVRGQQSAALLIVGGERAADPWNHERARLHVEDHPSPLVELRRLLVLRRAYDLLEQADEDVAAQDLAAAAVKYSRALALAPDVTELRFWTAVSLFTAGAHDDGREHFRELVAIEPHWREVLDHIAASDLFPDDLRDLGR